MIPISRIFIVVRVVLVVVAISLLVSSCSSSTTDSTTTVPPSTTSTTTATTAATVEPEPPEPVIIPIGERWTEVLDSELTSVSSTTEIDGELWIIGDRFNRSVLLRSSDDGLTWEPTEIAPPVTSGTIRMNRVAQGSDGRIVGIGDRGDNCDVAIDAGDGNLVTGLCFEFRPLIHISDDGGDSWTQLEPSSLASSSGSVFLTDIAVSDDGFIAVGTIRGSDWRGGIWTSTDGETWELNTEVRGEGHSNSLDRILIDDEGTIVVLGREHPCSEPFVSRAGWVLGTKWAEHVRVYQGPDLVELALQTETDNPLAPPPADIDCGSQDEFEIAEIPYPSVTGEVLGGSITLLGTSALDEAANETEALHQVFRLMDDDWIETGSSLELSPRLGPLLIGVDADPALVVDVSNAGGQIGVNTITSGSGEWETVESVEPLDSFALTTAFGRHETVLILGSRLLDPDQPLAWPENPRLVVVWRSTQTLGE